MGLQSGAEIADQCLISKYEYLVHWQWRC